MTPEKIGDIAVIFLSFRDQLKIYHWQTTSYSRHKATDKLLTIMNEQIDRFMETLQGSRGKRLVINQSTNTLTIRNCTHEDANTLLIAFKSWLLSGLDRSLEPYDKDLNNIRDEILGSVNKTLYLFSLS